MDNLGNLNTAIIKKNNLNSSTNLNEILITGFYSWYAEAGFPTNFPTVHTSRGLLLVITFDSHTSQTIYDSDSKIYHRFKTQAGWSSWS